MVTVAELVKGYGPNFPPLETLLGMKPKEAELAALEAPTPELGRYFKNVHFLSNVTSQLVLDQVRFHVMKEYIIGLSDLLTKYDGIHRDRKVVHDLSPSDKRKIRKLALTPDASVQVALIEKFTEHDTAAAGDYLKLLTGTTHTHLEPMIEGFNFAETSEDNMGPTFGLIANKVVYGYFLPKVLDFMEDMLNYVSHWEKDVPLVIPGFTHVQGAEPTTLGKKFTTNLKSIDYHIRRMMNTKGKFRPFTGKLGGAIGNLTTHIAAYPDIDWGAFSEKFVTGLGLTYDDMTFQSVTYDLEAGHFTDLAHMMTHILKFTDDFVNLAACPGQFFVKKKTKGTKGSSLMPNKSNAWGQEGAQEMLIKSRSDLFLYAERLPSFPHEGNMGRSYLLRALGEIFMPAFIALDRIKSEILGRKYPEEFNGYVPNLSKIAACFNEYPGMAASSIQTILKREGIPGDAYRVLEGISINSDSTYANQQQFSTGLERVMGELNLPDRVRIELRASCIPSNSIGAADRLAKKEKALLRNHIAEYLIKLKRYQKPLVSLEHKDN